MAHNRHDRVDVFEGIHGPDLSRRNSHPLCDAFEVMQHIPITHRIARALRVLYTYPLLMEQLANGIILFLIHLRPL